MNLRRGELVAVGTSPHKLELLRYIPMVLPGSFR